MDAVVPILSYTELPRGSSIGFERSGEGCTIRFRAPRVRPQPAPPAFTPPTAGQLWWSLLLVPAFGLLWLFFWACGISLLEFARTLAMVTATVVPVMAVLIGLITAHLFIRGALP